MSTTEKLYFEVPKRFIETKALTIAKGTPSKAHSYFFLFFDSHNHKPMKKDFVHCKLCFDDWKTDKKTSTNNLFAHLKDAHKLDFSKDKNVTRIDVFLKSQSTTLTEYYFLFWIALDNSPLSKVEGIGF